MEPSDEDVLRLAQSLTDEHWAFLATTERYSLSLYGLIITSTALSDDLIDKGVACIDHEAIQFTSLGRRVYAWRDVLYGGKY